MRRKHVGSTRDGIVASMIVSALLIGAPAVASAARGDCGQPVSNGGGPVATDCLFILQAAVGTQTCDPLCTCDLNASGGTANATDALACLNASVGAPGLLNCECDSPSTDGDDFDDNAKDATKWGPDLVRGNGSMTETSQRLEYRCNAGTSYDEVGRPWIRSVLPYDANWAIHIDVGNSTNPTGNTQVNSFGFELYNPSRIDDYLFVELYASSWDGPPARNGFYAELGFDEGDYRFVDTGDLGATRGAVRMTFDATAKVVTVHYDENSADGHQWTSFGSFGIAGAGGNNGNGNWGLSSGDSMAVYVYGFSRDMQIGPGQMWGDDFSITGAILP
jgi:hypothetical protein